MNPVQAVLDEHAPRGSLDPMYVPWWAKGEYARKNKTTYRMTDGTVITAGAIATRGSGLFTAPPALFTERSPDAVLAAKPVKPMRPEPKSAGAELSPDIARSLLIIHKSREARIALCEAYGIDPSIYTGAPNPGVAAMRLVNAIRRITL
jgi:hypothetical protein